VKFAELQERFSEAVGAEVRVESLGSHDTRVFVPFEFPDGDGLVVRLREVDGAGYEWTDMGHTFMHLSYDLDMDALESGNRKTFLEGIQTRAGLEEREGELVLPTDQDVVAGDLFQFVQALLQISDLRFLTRERVRSTFTEDLEGLLSKRFAERAQFGYSDSEHDPERRYPIDCLLNHLPRPLAIFGVGSDSQAGDATITLLQFQKWGRDMFAMGIYEDMEKLSGKSVARLSDVVDKQFSSLAGNETAIADYIEREIARQRV
jgi:Domain of unknown function DUF1828